MASLIAKQKSLTTLVIKGLIPNDAFCESLKTNKSLVTLKFDQDLEVKDYQKMAAALKDSQTMTSLTCKQVHGVTQDNLRLLFDTLALNTYLNNLPVTYVASDEEKSQNVGFISSRFLNHHFNVINRVNARLSLYSLQSQHIRQPDMTLVTIENPFDHALTQLILRNNEHHRARQFQALDEFFLIAAALFQCERIKPSTFNSSSWMLITLNMLAPINLSQEWKTKAVQLIKSNITNKKWITTETHSSQYREPVIVTIFTLWGKKTSDTLVDQQRAERLMKLADYASPKSLSKK